MRSSSTSDAIQPHIHIYRKMLGKSLASLFTSLIGFLARSLAGVHPNVISVFAFGFAVLASVFIFLGGWFLLLAALTLMANLILDLVDGAVARLSGLSSERGKFLDMFLDRVGECALFFGIGVAPYTHPYIGFISWAANALHVYLKHYSYMVTPHEGYEYSSFTGRGGLIVLLTLGCIAQYVLGLWGLSTWQIGNTPISLLDGVVLVLMVVSVRKGVLVFRRIWKTLATTA